MREPSAYQRVADATKELAIAVEELGEVVYLDVESETLKRVAIEAGIDFTIDPVSILQQLGETIQRERDVNRELRRQVAALTQEVERARSLSR